MKHKRLLRVKNEHIFWNSQFKKLKKSKNNNDKEYLKEVALSEKRVGKLLGININFKKVPDLYIVEEHTDAGSNHVRFNKKRKDAWIVLTKALSKDKVLKKATLRHELDENLLYQNTIPREVLKKLPKGLNTKHKMAEHLEKTDNEALLKKLRRIYPKDY
jgi:hypothetical protein